MTDRHKANRNRWRIRALLVEALTLRQFVRTSDCSPLSASRVEVVAVMREADMQPVGATTWVSGAGTYDWVTFWYHGVRA